MKEALTEKELTQEESLQLITRMIGKARAEYLDTGIGALMWGAIITFCSLVAFSNAFLHYALLNMVWLMPLIAVFPQVLISVREHRARKAKQYEDDAIGGIWLSFAAAMLLLSVFRGRYHLGVGVDISLMLYGMPTFATGYARRFKPMIVGGIACWIFAFLCGFTPPPYQFLFMAAAAQLAWFIPGLMLRKCYLKAKRSNV